MIVFCTTCKGRAQHLEQTLPQNLSDNAAFADCKFVVLDYGSKDHLLPYLKTRHGKDIDSGRLVVYSYATNGPFRMAHAKNMGHRLGIQEGGSFLVNVDADGFTGDGFAEFLAGEIAARGNNIVFQAMWNRWIDVDGNRRWAAEDPNGVIGPPVPKGCNGRIGVSVDAFVKVGGYNEKFNAWGPDDKDFNIRLRRLGIKPYLIPRKHLETVSHNDKVRFREYPHAAENKSYGFDVKVEDSSETIVNWGNVGCGKVYRNFDQSHTLDLKSIPTRIFGIGMHKTATTSLNVAFKVLGIHGGHWENAHWARAIWDEMAATGRSLSMERFYAVSDLPITMLYKELDKAYPGSKFILTIRDEHRWLQSVRNHWNHDKNPHRWRWDNDPFTHRAHRLLYGQKGFDAELFLARYRRHNAEVREYFANRPCDLLVMDMDAGAGWPQLCGFLGKPIPAIEYPREFATKT